VSEFERRKYISQAKLNRYQVTGYYFESIVPDCLSRNQNRSGKDKIQKVGILAKFKQLQVPSFAEGFDELNFVKIEGDRFTVKQLSHEI
jgi:hypothetical protein